MGIIKQGILGGFSGKVANVVGGTWKGISYMRSVPQSVTNPQTEPQLAQRAKWSLIMGFCKALSQFLKIGFKLYAVKMTGMNAAFSYNIKNAIQGTYPNFTINYANARVSQGSLTPALNQAAASTVAGTVAFTWDDNGDELGAADTDKTLIVVYNAIKNQAVAVNYLATRVDGAQSITVPDSWSGDLVQCYIGFISADLASVSNSAFAGAVTVA